MRIEGPELSGIGLCIAHRTRQRRDTDTAALASSTQWRAISAAFANCCELTSWLRGIA